VRKEERLELLLEFRDRSGQARELGLRLGGHFGIVNADELADFRELVIVLVERVGLFDHLHEPLVLATQRRHEPGIAECLRVEQLPFDFRRAGDRVGEEVPEAQALAGWGLEYFWRKRSTRPAVSISFCLPVKKGWQAAQISRWISAWVLRVVNVFPHAQLTFATA